MKVEGWGLLWGGRCYGLFEDGFEVELGVDGGFGAVAVLVVDPGAADGEGVAVLEAVDEEEGEGFHEKRGISFVKMS